MKICKQRNSYQRKASNEKSKEGSVLSNHYPVLFKKKIPLCAAALWHTNMTTKKDHGLIKGHICTWGFDSCPYFNIRNQYPPKICFH